MKVIKIQVALFFRDIISRPDILAENINQKLGNMFDAMPTCVDLPLDAPAEIPIVYRKSTKLPHQLNVARSRCDLILTPMVENNSLAVIESRYNNEILEYIKAAMEGNDVIRIGIVYTVFQEAEKPCDYISTKYFGGLIKGENELSFRVNKVTNIKGVETNSVFNVSNAIAETNGKKDEGVLYIRDINNVVKTTSSNLTLKQITNILKHSYSMLDDNVFGEAK